LYIYYITKIYSFFFSYTATLMIIFYSISIISNYCAGRAKVDIFRGLHLNSQLPYWHRRPPLCLLLANISFICYALSFSYRLRMKIDIASWRWKCFFFPVPSLLYSYAFLFLFILFWYCSCLALASLVCFLRYPWGIFFNICM